MCKMYALPSTYGNRNRLAQLVECWLMNEMSWDGILLGTYALLLHMYSSLETTVTIKETLQVYQHRNDHYKLLSHEAECCNDY